MPISKEGKEYLKMLYKNKEVGTITKISETQYVLQIDKIGLNPLVLPFMLFGFAGMSEPTQEQIQV